MDKYTGSISIGNTVGWVDMVDGSKKTGAVISIDPVYAIIEVEDNDSLIEKVEHSLTQENMNNVYGNSDLMFFSADIICTDGKRYSIDIRNLEVKNVKEV